MKNLDNTKSNLPNSLSDSELEAAVGGAGEGTAPEGKAVTVQHACDNKAALYDEKSSSVATYDPCYQAAQAGQCGRCKNYAATGGRGMTGVCTVQK